MDKELTITKQYFDEIINFTARSLVGKCLKRMEIIEDRNVLKQNIKEITYEHFRDFSNLFMAYQKGKNELTQFKFTKRD